MFVVPHNLSAGNYSVGGAVSSILEIRQNRLAIQFAAEAAAEYGMSAAAFDPMGKINAAATERGLRLNQDFGDSLEPIGEPHESLDAAQMRGITGSDYYLAGASHPGAVLPQPACYIRNVGQGIDSPVGNWWSGLEGK